MLESFIPFAFHGVVVNHDFESSPVHNSLNRGDFESLDGGNPEATGGPAGLGLGPSIQTEDVLGRDDVKAYLKGVQVSIKAPVACSAERSQQSAQLLRPK